MAGRSLCDICCFVKAQPSCPLFFFAGFSSSFLSFFLSFFRKKKSSYPSCFELRCWVLFEKKKRRTDNRTHVHMYTRTRTDRRTCVAEPRGTHKMKKKLEPRRWHKAVGSHCLGENRNFTRSPACQQKSVAEVFKPKLILS